jgi:hypothetical protein
MVKEYVDALCLNGFPTDGTCPAVTIAAHHVAANVFRIVDGDSAAMWAQSQTLKLLLSNASQVSEFCSQLMSDQTDFIFRIHCFDCLIHTTHDLSSPIVNAFSLCSLLCRRLLPLCSARKDLL